MIRSELHSAALQAIQDFLIRGRLRAEDGASVQSLEKMFDDAEYLVGRLLTPDDDTQVFVEYLEGASEEFGCRGIYSRFVEQTSLAAV